MMPTRRPALLPKASDRPVTMMMITAMILATGPSIDCRICWSGCSHGMLEPAANAGAARAVVATNAAIAAIALLMRAGRSIMCGLQRVRDRRQARDRNRRYVSNLRCRQVRPGGVANRDPRARQ